MRSEQPTTENENEMNQQQEFDGRETRIFKGGAGSNNLFKMN